MGRPLFDSIYRLGIRECISGVSRRPKKSTPSTSEFHTDAITVAVSISLKMHREKRT